MGFAFKRLNGPLLLVHFLAVPCFILGGQLLERIRWVPLRQAFQTHGLAGAHQVSGMTASEMILQLHLGPTYAWLGAILLGCLLSGLVVWRRRESAAIPLLLFGLAVVTSWTHYYNEPGRVMQGLSNLLALFPHASRQSQLGLVGSALLVLGVVPFLLTWPRPGAAPTAKASA
ncbi:hypothetical protein I2I05_21000 [Hymenobacter sp. BT683]|uniref:Uncharacterized protein n=1 Tax=Hymenobacter jeongseonensis TaxID=2791027 RepID=A0ABS0INE2_9BACT|nr:hypothetical protein [Hymenobacter jeongseonensis]MBF9239883.1 hypothetical protein [Hymenobacter jeongseonensis]